jgi:hypothetical protein
MGFIARIRCGFVIPAEWSLSPRRRGAGIQKGPFFLDTRLRGCDGCGDRSDTWHFAGGSSFHFEKEKR